MRHSIVRAAVIAILVFGVTRAFAVPTGAVATRTGARAFGTKAAEPTCTVCHTPNASGIPPGINDPSGSLSLLGVPANYTPGAIYLLTVHLQHDWSPVPPDPLRWGFQLQAIQASTGDSAGTWPLSLNVPPDSFKIVKALSTSVYKNRRYVDQAGWTIDVEHPGGPTHYGEVGPVEWHVAWQAPPGDSGKIYFFAAGNSTNGDNMCNGSGDFVFTTSESTTAAGATAVPGAPGSRLTALDAPLPNPMHGSAELGFSIEHGGVTDLSIFDLSGRRVATVLHEFRNAGTYGLTWNGRDDLGLLARNGLYFVRLISPDRQTLSQKLVLSR
jgi:hypothetical protein